MDISSDLSKEGGHLGSSFDLESNCGPAIQRVYSRRKSKKDRRGMFNLRFDPTPAEKDIQKEGVIYKVISLDHFHSMCNVLFVEATASCCSHLLLVHFSVLCIVGGFSHHNQTSATSFLK